MRLFYDMNQGLGFGQVCANALVRCVCVVVVWRLNGLTVGGHMTSCVSTNTRYVSGTNAYSTLKLNECFLPRYSHAEIYPTPICKSKYTTNTLYIFFLVTFYTPVCKRCRF